MSLQQSILQQYRLHFPQESLREVSARTGIQITRVFRLFNGKTMKVGELEAFQSAIQQKIYSDPSTRTFARLFNDAVSKLSSEELEKVNDHIERRIQNQAYRRILTPSETHHQIA